MSELQYRVLVFNLDGYAAEDFPYVPPSYDSLFAEIITHDIKRDYLSVVTEARTIVATVSVTDDDIIIVEGSTAIVFLSSADTGLGFEQVGNVGAVSLDQIINSATETKAPIDKEFGLKDSGKGVEKILLPLIATIIRIDGGETAEKVKLALAGEHISVLTNQDRFKQLLNEVKANTTADAITVVKKT